MKNYLTVTIGAITGYIHRDGEIELSRAGDDEQAVSGRGRGDLTALRLVWGCLLTWALRHHVEMLWCEPTSGDGRGETRRRVYSRVGFVRDGDMMRMALGGEKMTIINCTPHPVTYRDGDREVTWEPSGIVPRVATIEEPTDSIESDGISLSCVTQSTGQVEGLPTACSCGSDLDEWGYCLRCSTRHIHIVSAMVFNAADRTDLIAPDTGKGAIRDDNGRIVAVSRFLRRG